MVKNWLGFTFGTRGHTVYTRSIMSNRPTSDNDICSLLFIPLKLENKRIVAVKFCEDAEMSIYPSIVSPLAGCSDPTT
jgi:hypothetical protein